MPWTFSHPAAVLPLKRLCPRYLHFPALLVGSTTPDVGYYVGQFDLARLGHTLLGGFLVCLPAGLLLLCLFGALRQPLLFLLPRIHRDVIGSRLFPPEAVSLHTLLRMAVSIVVGAWSHVAWDAFTHAGRWGATHVPWIEASALSFYSISVPMYVVLQHASTGLGVLLLALGYRRLLRSHRAREAYRFADELGDLHRRRLLALLAWAAAGVAVMAGLGAAHGSSASHALSTFFFVAAVSGTLAFAALYVITALLIHGWRARAPG